MDFLVLPLQRGNAVAVSVTCKHGDSVAEVLKCGSSRLNFLIIMLVAKLFFCCRSDGQHARVIFFRGLHGSRGFKMSRVELGRVIVF